MTNSAFRNTGALVLLLSMAVLLSGGILHLFGHTDHDLSDACSLCTPASVITPESGPSLGNVFLACGNPPPDGPRPATDRTLAGSHPTRAPPHSTTLPVL